MVTKYYVFGDTGGHLDVLQKGLENIGVDVTNYKIPEDIVIIHLGDLIHKGKSSFRALEFVEVMHIQNPGQWIQLMGNHELQHLPHANWFYPCLCALEVDDLISHFVTSGIMRTAFALEDVTPQKMEVSARHRMKPQSHDWLFTHGGLTRHWWTQHHDSERSVTKLAESINSLTDHQKDIAGERMGNPLIEPSPVWASAPTEVFRSWVNTGMPFNQVVGHTYPFDWEQKKWFGNRRAVKDYIQATVLNQDLRIALTKIGDGLLAVADPGFETRTPSIDAQPGILFGTK